MYAFFKEHPNVVRKNNRKKIHTTYLEFTCLKCLKSFLWGTGTDSRSTGVMCEHVPLCWHMKQGEKSWSGTCKRCYQEIQGYEKCKTHWNVYPCSWIKGNIFPHSSLTWGNPVCYHASICYSSAKLVDSVTVAQWVSKSMCPFLSSRIGPFGGFVRLVNRIFTSRMWQLWLKMWSVCTAAQSIGYARNYRSDC